jgi:hypothetical protein
MNDGRDNDNNNGRDDMQVLMLQHLTYGKGLPASMEEVNLIHKLREKRVSHYVAANL